MWWWFLVCKYTFPISVTCAGFIFFTFSSQWPDQVHLLLRSVWTWSSCSWQCHSLAKLASSHPSPSFLAAGRLVFGGQWPFREVQVHGDPVALTSSHGNTARFAAHGEAGCLTRSVQTDLCGRCQWGWVWCCRALQFEVKLQTVSGQTNTHLFPTRWAQGERIRNPFPGTRVFQLGCMAANQRREHHQLLGRGRARAGDQTGWGWWKAGPTVAGETAGWLLQYSPPVWTLQQCEPPMQQRGEHGKENKLCVPVWAGPHSSVCPKWFQWCYWMGTGASDSPDELRVFCASEVIVVLRKWVVTKPTCPWSNPSCKISHLISIQ